MAYQHQAYQCIVPGADTAVLLIHGILGTPRHFDPLLPALPEHVSVCALLLEGHGGSAQNFSRASMAQWARQVEQAVAQLIRTHRRLYIVAHSMGTLLAIQQAVEHPEITGLFLLAVPIRVRLRPRMLSNSWNIYSGRIRSDDPVGRAAQRCCGITPDKNLLHYLGWIPRYMELFSQIRHVRHLLPRLTVPCIACQSMQDEMVAPSSAAYLCAHSGIRAVTLPRSGHFYYESEDLTLLLEELSAFLTDADAPREQTAEG